MRILFHKFRNDLKTTFCVTFRSKPTHNDHCSVLCLFVCLPVCVSHFLGFLTHLLLTSCLPREHFNNSKTVKRRVCMTIQIRSNSYLMKNKIEKYILKQKTLKITKYFVSKHVDKNCHLKHLCATVTLWIIVFAIDNIIQ